MSYICSTKIKYMSDLGERIENSKELFSEGYNCAQATLSGLNVNELNSNQVQMIASAFGGGMARTGDKCGVVTGALMGLGLKQGYTLSNKKEKQEICVQKAQLFMNRFIEEFGSLNCNDLTGYDLSNDAERKEAGEKGVFKNACPKFVEAAIKIMDEIMSTPD